MLPGAVHIRKVLIIWERVYTLMIWFSSVRFTWWLIVIGFFCLCFRLCCLKVISYQNDTPPLTSSDFDASRMTRVIVHGFYNSGFEPWVLAMKDAFLQIVCTC